ncbi:MAG: hypothetical protein U0840_23295 [Gemmataceae bacterium]
MALEWRTICMDALLADGKIDEAEVKVLQKALKQKDDPKIHQEGLTFILELRLAATKKAKARKEELTEAFEKYFMKSVHDYVVKDGEISAYEANWLRENLFADKKIDDREWALLQSLNKKAKKKAPEFEKLYADCEAIRAKAAAKK